ncbi:hypothetical protein ACHQM5_014003 [Ranunculus cassubicifolius]
MIPKLWHLREMSRIVPRYIHSVAFRFSTMSEVQQEPPTEVDLLSFFKSILDEIEGPNHCWLNKVEENKVSFTKTGPFLVLANVFRKDSSELGFDHVLMFERAKYLQQRYPQLCVFGFQCETSFCSVSFQAHIVHTIMEEYLTFPILLSNKDFPEMRNGAHYLIFKDFNRPMMCYDNTTEFETVREAIEELNPLCDDISKTSQELKSDKITQLDVLKEPCIPSFRNLSLYCPGCITADKVGDRLFLSDSNHHRIIVFDTSGKIIDCIGSSPGLEDGEFETAKLLRPAASLYNTDEDCLYFVDSENHAIRRADMVERIVETIYPPRDSGNKFRRIWNNLLDKFGIEREVALKSEDSLLEPLVAPWHMMMSEENNLIIINRSLSRLWILDQNSGKIEKVVTGYPKILEICEDMIMARLSLHKQLIGDKFKPIADCSSKWGLTDILNTQFATFDKDIIICNPGTNGIQKFNRETGSFSNLDLSNFGVLGLPYWLTLPLEKYFVGANTYQRLRFDHLQSFSVLPGRCDIHININIPVDTELAVRLQEGCIWRQARGSAAEVSRYDDTDTSTEKVGVAQQWFDELDNLAFSGTGSETSIDDENNSPGPKVQEKNRVQIHSVINISPGTSEVIIYAVLYLRIKKDRISEDENVKRILNIGNPKNKKPGTDACMQLMIDRNTDLGEVVFMKPLHLRLEFDCLDHPKADKANEVVLTDSTIEVNVSL